MKHQARGGSRAVRPRAVRPRAVRPRAGFRRARPANRRTQESSRTGEEGRKRIKERDLGRIREIPRHHGGREPRGTVRSQGRGAVENPARTEECLAGTI